MSEIVKVVTSDGASSRRIVSDPVEALRMLALAPMRPFTKDDWYGYSGCETKDPMIGDFEEFVIILDGNTINIIHGDDGFGGEMFKLEAM